MYNKVSVAVSKDINVLHNISYKRFKYVLIYLNIR